MAHLWYGSMMASPVTTRLWQSPSICPFYSIFLLTAHLYVIHPLASFASPRACTDSRPFPIALLTESLADSRPFPITSLIEASPCNPLIRLVSHHRLAFRGRSMTSSPGIGAKNCRATLTLTMSVKDSTTMQNHRSHHAHRCAPSSRDVASAVVSRQAHPRATQVPIRAPKLSTTAIVQQMAMRG